MFGLVLMLFLGAIFLFIGWRLWKKEQITLIHDYHHTNISKENIKPYTEKMGKAYMVIGSGMILTSIFNITTNTSYGWIGLGLFFVLGLIMIIKAQKKYNGGQF